jgi:hypothetical protein
MLDCNNEITMLPFTGKDKALRVRVFWSLSLTHWSLKDSTGVFMSF